MVHRQDRSVSEEKDSLRREVSNRLAALTAQYIAESDAGIAARVAALPEYAAARRIFAYWSVGRECDTRTIIARGMAEGKSVALPVSRRGGEMDFHVYSGALSPGLLDIPEPVDGEPAEPAAGELMLVPALCCALDGTRLGHGGGYYDRYLAERSCFTVCLCREELLMKKIPRDWNDIPVRAVITEKRLLRI